METKTVIERVERACPECCVGTMRIETTEESACSFHTGEECEHDWHATEGDKAVCLDCGLQTTVGFSGEEVFFMHPDDR